jgi:hypothetical protein
MYLVARKDDRDQAARKHTQSRTKGSLVRSSMSGPRRTGARLAAT